MVFAIFYDIGDAVAGISTGILAGAAGGGALGGRAAVEAVKALFADPTKNLTIRIGVYAWIAALVAVAISLHRAGAPRVPLLLLAPAAFFLSFDHAFPLGSLTFAFFFLAALWLELDRRGRVPRREDAPGPQPSPARRGAGA